MATSPPQWIWSAEYRNYYYVTYSGDSIFPLYHWAPQNQPFTISNDPDWSPPSISPGPVGSSTYPTDSTLHSVPRLLQGLQPNPTSKWPRGVLPYIESERPHQGRNEALDPDYYMRRGAEAHDFFKNGRVFSMLWSEPAGAKADDDDLWSETVHVGKFGEPIHQQIRRFVIVHVKRRDHFVYACPISTYSSRGTAKPGVNPKEHAIVYMSGTSPTYLPGESPSSMREPIEVVPTNGKETLDRASRLRFGKTFPIEWNVKVKDIGRIAPSDMSKLIGYWKEEHMELDFDGDDMARLNAPFIEGKQSDFEPVQNPKGFFKKGRVFTILWSEGPQAVEKTFAVIRPMGQSAECLLISSSGRNRGDYASDGSHQAEIITLHEGEEPPTSEHQSKVPIFVIIEANGTALPPLSWIDFSRTYNVAFAGNPTIRKIGRVVPSSIWRLQKYQEEVQSLGRVL